MTKGYDFTGVSLVFFCHDGHGRFLMAKRKDTCRDEHGCWDPGGGGLEFGEKVEEALRREIFEEYATTAECIEFLGYRDVHREHQGHPTHWIALDFKVRVLPELVKNNEPHKHEEIGWFSLNKLPSPVHSQFPTFVEKYGERLR